MGKRGKFCLETGKLKWTFVPEHSIRHNAIAIGDGRVYLIDRPQATADTRFGPKTGREEVQRRAAASGRSEEEEFRRLTEHPTGRLLALDVETGKVLWRTDKEIFGTLLAFSAKHDVVLMG